MAALLSLAAAMVGCDRTGELAENKGSPVGHFVAKDDAAGRLLEQTAAAYSRLTSYSDSARVVLSYQVDGKPAQDTAPLAVAYERPNRLALKAYQTAAGVNDQRFRMRLVSNASSALHRQLLSRQLPRQMDVNWLMLDALAAQHLSAGLAGAPPQLDLLMSDRPFRALLDESAIVSLDGEGAEQGKTYHIVKIERGQAKYRLWIDRSTSLLRRIELPTATLPKAMLDDRRISDIRLSVEFDDVITGAPVNWSQWQVSAEALDQMVRYFVAPPAIELDPRLGKAIPAFRLKPPPTAEGLAADKLATRGVDTSATAEAGQIQVFIWAADHPSCRTTIEQIEQGLRHLSPEVRKQIAPLVVWAEPRPAAGTSFADLPQKWNFTFPIVLDDAAIGRDIFSVQEAPTIVILDRQHCLQFFQERANPLLAQALPEMLTRLASGESLAKTMSERMQAEQSRYTAQLWLARSADCNAGAFTQPEPYAPQWIALSEPQVHSTAQPIAAMTSDAQHNLWTLTVDGALECRDSRGATQAEFTTDWSSAPADLVRLAIDAKGKYVAMRGAVANQLQVLDTTTRKTSTVALGSGQAVVDFRWLPTASGSQLAAITSASRTVLIDPTRNGQHSGQSVAPPVALLERVEEDKLASGYAILADGRIEPVIVEGQAGAQQAALAKPVSTGAEPVLSPIVERQLKFTPAAGPWTVWRDAKQTATLARGWIADTEPAVFLLDEQLRQLWHAPLPITHESDAFCASVAHDPVSGQPLWVVAQPKSTLHFFRADGGLVDHCQLAEPVRGLAAVPSGNELHLWVAHPQSLVRYRMK